MKKILSSILLLVITITASAQKNDKEKAFDLVVENNAALGLDNEAINNSIVTDTYFNESAGTQMVYLQQTYLGLPVNNQIQTLAFKNGKPVSAFGERIKGMPTKAGLGAIPNVTPEHALQTALTSKGIKIESTIKKTVLSNTKFNFGRMNISHEDITVELMWEPIKNHKDVYLIWQVYVAPTTSSDYLLIRIDALNGSILKEVNLTVSCDFGHPHPDGVINHDETHNKHVDNASLLQPTSPNLVSSASYRVVPYPAESPLHPGGTPALVTNPWTLAPGNPTSLGWHNDGAFDYISSRGNNVFVQEDRDDNNSTIGTPATSTTFPDPLTFDFVPNFTVHPTQITPVPNQQFNMTNLFYWINLAHDISYIYGFNEVSGNFQNSNQGRGGQGNDYIIADAQDAGGTNNANFATPPDGQRPRMQVYLWGSGAVPRDACADNATVVHEFGHGVSNRLTGGPSRSDCLYNEESMGEGWSDYLALMYTQNWAASNLNSGYSSPRGMSPYAAGQNPNGGGIRSQRYCTNFTINNKVYSTSLPTSSHSRGEIWCATLWDMTWNIINEVGSINPTIFDSSSAGGNAVALRLVMEGMRLQPCYPGFIDGRNAILQADQILYGGRFACAIKEAFRRRGMGIYASQGSSDDLNDQRPDYSGGVSVVLSQGGMTEVPEGQNIVYTNTVSSPCQTLTDFILRDTIPNNVTWVSGGNYDPVTRIVSWSVNMPAGSTQTYQFTVNVNIGSYFPTTTLYEETVPGNTMPASLSNSSTPTPSGDWRASNIASHSASYAMFAPNLTASSDQRLLTQNTIALPANTSPRLNFWHRFDTEAGWDGGIVELTTNNGVTWRDLGQYMFTNGYNGQIGTNPDNILSGKNAFTGNTNNTFINTWARLNNFAGQNIKLRFRFASDANTSGEGTTPGWFIDDIVIMNQALVDMRSGLHNSANVLMSYSDTTTIIVEQSTCANAEITTQPSAVNVCNGNNASFTVTASGTDPEYQWQVSTDGGATWSDITGASSATFQLTNVQTSSNGYRYRVIISNDCPSSIISNTATLSVSEAAGTPSTPSNATVCEGGSASFSVTVTGSSNTYQWQVSTDGGTAWTDVAGANTSNLSLNNITLSQNNNQYHLVITSCAGTITSGAATLIVNANASVTSQPQDAAVCENNSATFSVVAAGTAVSYQWQISTDGGTTWSNITGAIAASYTINNVTSALNNNKYRVSLSNVCTTLLLSNEATLTITNNASISTQPVSQTVCVGSNASFNITGGGIQSYQWQISTNGGTTWTDLSGETNATLTIASVTTAMNNNQYRVVVSGCNATGLTSNAATLTLHPETVINQQPTSQSGCVGTSVSFGIDATGLNLAYQWQVSTDGGATWNNVAGETTINLTVNINSATQNNHIYRVNINGTCTNNMASGTATLTIPANPVIIDQPQDQQLCENETASFGVVANNGNTYQWEVSTDNGTTWTPIAGATSNAYTISNVNPSQNYYQYHVIITGTCNDITSNAGVLIITTHPSIEINGPDYDVCTGSTITLSGIGADSYSWDNGVTDGVPFVINNTTTYTVTGTAGVNCTGSANITVNVITGPNVTITASANPIEPGETTVLTAQSNPAATSYQWYKNGVVIAGATSSSININEAGSYTVEVTGANGCTSLSNGVTIIVEEPHYAFITPNPNTGVFHVNYPNVPGLENPREINVYDAKGARIFNKAYQKTEAAVEKMEVNLGKVSTGVYMVVLMQNGKKLKSGKVYIRF